LLHSVEQSPSGRIDPAALAEEFTDLVGAMFVAAIEIGLPVLAALFATEVALGLLGKAAPQLNILVLGFAIKSIVAAVLLAATLFLLPGATSSLLEQAVRSGARLFGG
jgi:flagellar biosynthetic protein FliR